MEKFIKIGDVLLDNYQWAGGIRSTPKEQKDRRKALERGLAIVIEDPENFFNNKRRRSFQRKLFK